MIKKINGYIIYMTKKLGKGSYGIVYEGEQSGTKMPCAVKVLDKSNSTFLLNAVNSDPYLKAALISQIKIMKCLKNENIVQLFDVMESNNNYYIIQELCDMDLQNFLKQQPGKLLKQVDAVRLLTQICNGFLTLVKEGILHRQILSQQRDLKPANIFISKKKVKIGDFGFAKKSTGGLKNHTAVGTPLYMPIQILKGVPYTSKCDIWAIGFIFYEILHGMTPWTARSEYELIKNIQTKPLKIQDNLSDHTKDFLYKTLQMTEQKRISWDELFAHPIFNRHFDAEFKKGDKLQNKYKKVMVDIRFQVNSQNIHLKKLWQSLGYGDNKQLNQEQFKRFITSIIPVIDKEEIDYFFMKMDYNKDSRISLKELEKEFLKYEIPLTSKFQDRIPFLLKKMVSFEDDTGEMSKDHGIDLELENKVRACFKKMETILLKKKLDLFKVFLAYDGDKSGQLTLNEFSKILKKMDSSFSENEISCIFGVIDQDNSKTIQFEQLNSYYSKINGIPQSMNLPPQYYLMKKGLGVGVGSSMKK